ncbi:hypothetical protein EPYR_01959 [Erwinia pyrifoliae DSM 12163]|nr:hypothetical protein EJP617_29060 [Erwinia sp. Ejp617]CAY74339.1 hypothetical protein EPYR_01959 [Erwinia pyrifoliae DSM 12163]
MIFLIIKGSYARTKKSGTPDIVIHQHCSFSRSGVIELPGAEL